MQDRGEAAPVLAVTELTKVYRGRKPVTAVDHITFELGRGEILGLLGPNGAGKTTTIQMLLSTLEPTSGRIEYFGRSLAEHRASILALVGYRQRRIPSCRCTWRSRKTSTCSGGSTECPAVRGRSEPRSC